MSYFGRGGWEYESIDALGQGETYLLPTYGVELGEPVCLVGTGMTARPFNKRQLKSYDATAGAEEAYGVSLDQRYPSATGIIASPAETLGMSVNEWQMLRSSFNRGIAVMIEGRCMMLNTSSTVTIEANHTVIPSNGGCQKMTATGQYVIGKSKQRILPLHRGMINVKIDYEKPII